MTTMIVSILVLILLIDVSFGLLLLCSKHFHLNLNLPFFAFLKPMLDNKKVSKLFDVIIAAEIFAIIFLIHYFL